MKVMKKTMLAVIIALTISVSAFAQEKGDSENALAVISKLFAEMANHKPAAIAELFTKESNLTAIVRRKDGKNSLVSFSGEKFSQNFAEKKNEIKEVMYAPKIEVFGELAVIYGRYVFFVDGNISHCGANAFHLVKTDAGWKIANASSTIDPTACTAEEKAMKP